MTRHIQVRQEFGRWCVLIGGTPETIRLYNTHTNRAWAIEQAQRMAADFERHHVTVHLSFDMR